MQPSPALGLLLIAVGVVAAWSIGRWAVPAIREHGLPAKAEYGLTAVPLVATIVGAAMVVVTSFPESASEGPIVMIAACAVGVATMCVLVWLGERAASASDARATAERPWLAGRRTLVVGRDEREVVRSGTRARRQGASVERSLVLPPGGADQHDAIATLLADEDGAFAAIVLHGDDDPMRWMPLLAADGLLEVLRRDGAAVVLDRRGGVVEDASQAS